MNRFSFRVWSVKENQYIDNDVFTLVGNDGTLYWVFGGALILPQYHKCIIEQCTGQKDRNGKLIYEGDIVRYMSRGLEFEGRVEWWTGVPYQNEDFGGWSIEIIQNTKWEHMDYSRDWETFEVIGNIHEVK